MPTMRSDACKANRDPGARTYSPPNIARIALWLSSGVPLVLTSCTFARAKSAWKKWLLRPLLKSLFTSRCGLK